MNLNDILLYEYGISFSCLENIKINRFSFDSKDINSGDVFIAINSGYKYIDEAINNGCIAIIISDNIDYVNESILVIKTHNMKKLLKNIASYIINKKNVFKIAITGSNGKTTTKELLYYGLKSKYKVLKNDGNNNNFLGLIKTIFKLNNEEFLVMEMGMNHTGEIKELSSILKPDIAIITNIGSAHIGNLGSKKNIFKAKMEIKEGNPHMLLFVNGNDHFLKRINAIKIKNNSFNYEPFFNYLKTNYNLVASVLKYFNFTNKEIISTFDNYQMYKQRMNIIYKGTTIIIDDTYNASLESTLGGLSFLKEYNQDKIIILGDILETGKYAIKIHKKINKYLKKLKHILVLHIGNYTKYIHGYHFDSKQELIKYLDSLNLSNKVIYLKGSRKMELELIRDNLLLKF